VLLYLLTDCKCVCVCIFCIDMCIYVLVCVCSCRITSHVVFVTVNAALAKHCFGLDKVWLSPQLRVLFYLSSLIGKHAHLPTHTHRETERERDRERERESKKERQVHKQKQ